MSHASGDGSAECSGSSRSGGGVLLVDDVAANLSALAAVLEPLHVRIERASSGAEALDRVRSDSFAVIMLDARMPGMDGYETAVRIRQLEAAQNAAIVFVSAADLDASSAIRAYGAGAVDFVAKPFDPASLRAKVSALLTAHGRAARLNASQLQAIEDRFALAVDIAQLGTWEYDPETGVLDADARCKSYLGIDGAAPLTLEAMLAAIHGDDRPAVSAAIARAIDAKERAPIALEYRTVNRADRAERFLASRGRALFDALGTALRVIGTVMDLTDRKEAERDRASMLIREQRLRLDAERAASRAERLQFVAAALAAARNSDEVAEVVISHAVGMVPGTAAALWLADDAQPRRLVLAAQRGHPEPKLAGMRVIDPQGSSLEALACRTAETIWVDAGSELRRLASQGVHERGGAVDESAHASIPLVVEQRTVGVLRLHFARGRDVEADERRFFAALAHQSALSLDRTRLLEREQSARVAAERSAARQRFLADSAAALAATTDPGTALQAIARFAVPSVADACAIDLFGADGSLGTVAIAHRTVADDTSLRAAWSAVRGSTHTDGTPARVAIVGEPLWLDGERASEGPFTVRSLMSVPLQARARPLGVFNLVASDPGRTFGADDRAMALDLARRIALAVENAILFDEVVESSRVKDEFLAVLSHELRTPLNAILGWSHMLRTSQLDSSKQEHALATIERNARAQARLVEDLLDVSRIVTGKLRLEHQAIDLAPLIESAIDSIRPAAHAKSLQLETAIADGVGVLHGDPHRLSQVVGNLLSNAVKFTPAGGRVAVRLKRDESYLALSVEDSGDGIRPEFLPHVFQRFRQADGSATRTRGGLGLGLSLVRDLVQLHGGTVSAFSEGEGKGATFTIRLPAPPAVSS